MQLFDRFEIVDAYPALYDPETDTVAISDLHLGLEGLMANQGTYMPKVQLETVKEDIEAIVEQVEPETLVVCGDIKHEFSKTTYEEREEVQAFIDFLSDLVEEIFLVQGNHDNYLIYYVDDYENVQLDDYFVVEDICFLHGHELIEDLQTVHVDCLIMGHEHPALALTDNVGITEKIDCFLYGTMNDDRNLIVLPAFSNLADGTAMNTVKNPETELLSPVLKKKIDLKTMKAVGVDKDAGLFEFPELEKI